MIGGGRAAASALLQQQRPPSHLPLLLLLLLLVVAVLQQLPPAAASCVAPQGAQQTFIDDATPDSACQLQLAGGPSNLRLVFSDEFSGNGSTRSAGIGSPRDPRWTAVDMYYASDYKEWQVYKPEQVAVKNGTLRITIEAKDSQAMLHASDYDKPVSSNITSGMLQSWQKFCFTGGFVEFAVRLPGKPSSSGFWAAAWLMGNLGRAGYYRSLEGVWPFTYDSCEGSGSPPWTNKTGQRISRCSHPAGRGAPEIDVLEFGLLGTPGVAQAVHTAQVGPVAPPGTSWMLPEPGGGGRIPGIRLPGAQDPQFQTELGSAFGEMTTPGFPRTGSNVTDTFTASSKLKGDSYWRNHHRYGVLWQPGELIRWYIDGKPLFEMDKESLRAQENAAGQRIEARLISTEPSYLIMNLAMAKDGWARVLWDTLELPAVMSVDFVRVYQPEGAISVGCDAPGRETSQYIACNRHMYIGDAERGAWQLPLCRDVTSAENSFLLGLAVSIAVVAINAVAMLVLLNSHARKAAAAAGKQPDNTLRAGSRLQGAARQAGCYLRHEQQHLQELLAHTRPDLLAVAKAQAGAAAAAAGAKQQQQHAGAGGGAG